MRTLLPGTETEQQLGDKHWLVLLEVLATAIPVKMLYGLLRRCSAQGVCDTTVTAQFAEAVSPILLVLWHQRERGEGGKALSFMQPLRRARGRDGS